MSKPIDLCEIKFLGRKFIVWKMFVELMKSSLWKNFPVSKFLFPPIFFSRKICLNTKIFFQTQNFLPLKIFRPQILQNFDQKFGQNWTSKKLRYCIYEQMSPGHICCLDKCHHNSRHLLNMAPRSYL